MKNMGPAASRTSATGPARPKDVRAALRVLWSMARPHHRLLWTSLALIVVNRIAGLVLPGSTKFLIDGVIGRNLTGLLLPLVSAVVLAACVQGVTTFVLVQSLSKAAQSFISELRTRVHAHVVRLPIAYFDNNSTGTLTARVMNDVEGIRVLLGSGLIQFVGGILTSVIALIALVFISPVLTAVALPILLILAFAIARSFKILRPMFRERSVISAEVTGRLGESLAGIRVVKAYAAEPRENATFAAGTRRLLDNALKTLNVISMTGLASSISLGVVGGLIMLIGAHEIAAGSLSVGGLFAYVLFLGFLVVPLAQVTNIGGQFGEAISGLERTRELLGEPAEDADASRSISLPTVTGDIEFEDVGFNYRSGEPILSSISFRARPGTVTALVGTSGSGKSTIISLVAGFYRPTSGRVLVDGIDLSTIRLDSYRQTLGAVLQDPFLFDGSIGENVGFSRAEVSATAIRAACDVAHVTEFAARFPDGLETLVGERGVRLSAGQRQRISIARAVVADPRILILDEATSSVDSESERLIQDGLAHLMRGRTTLVIAHRLSTIRSADQILVVEGGRIVERGDHATLHAARGRYHRLYERQHRRGAEPVDGDGLSGDEEDPVLVAGGPA